MDEKSLLKQVNASGFPFQLRVEALIKETMDVHKWRVLPSEHPWKNSETGKEGYIDLVLEGWGKRYRRYLVVECKRMRNDGRLIFLKSSPHVTQFETLVLLSEQDEDGSNILIWRELEMRPESYISSFCTVPGQADKQTPMLERISAELLDSVESLAETGLNHPLQNEMFRIPIALEQTIYFPVLVTNTELQVHLFYPKDVDLSMGEIPKGKGEFETIPYIRFQKSLFTRFPSAKIPMNFEEANRESQRTVFVVHAPHLPEFLKILNY